MGKQAFGYLYINFIGWIPVLLAMIGAIVLTLRHRADVKRQDILQQMYRDPNEALVMKDIKPGQGL